MSAVSFLSFAFSHSSFRAGNTKLDEVKETAKELLDLLAKVDTNSAIINELFKGKLPDDETMTEYMSRRMGELEGSRSANGYEKHHLWQRLREDVWHVHHPDEPLPDQAGDELFIARKTNLKCPLSTELLDEPMKNPVCGHTYSREAAEQYIARAEKRKEKPNCPVVGCGSVMGDLERDWNAEREVAKHKQGKKRARPTKTALKVE